MPAAQIDEDEEKFFDRIPVEILLTAMRVNGFPEQGFLEIKASGMGAKYVDIITKKGIAYAKFICGLEQGNPDSPTVANLVIKLKHDVWDYISNKASAIFKRNNSNTKGKYTFNSIDEQDGPITICKIGYCDDNSKYCFVKNEEDLNFLIKYYLQLAGDLSMVTKIGRKGSKSEIQFFNVSAKFALKIKKCFSTAWSFIHDAPISEEVPIKICLKDTEVKKFMEISDYENLDQEEQSKWDAMLFPKAHRHLGLTGTLSGMTNETCTKTLYKMRERIKNLKIPNMQDEAQVKCFNMLCSTIHSFVPLQAGYGAGELEKVDKEVIKLLKRSRGLSKTDAKHSIFLPPHLGGMGFKSIQDVDLISTARELEIISNGNSIDAEIFRTRLAAIPKYTNEEKDFCSNHAWNAIKKLAGFGIYLRDKSEHMINAIFSRIEQLPRYQGIGSGNFSNGNKPLLGNGRNKNREIMFGGTIHRILHLLQSVNWNICDFRKIYTDKSPIDLRKLIQFRKEACISHFHELASLFSHWEWINTDRLQMIPSDRSEWNFVNIPKMIQEKFPKTYWQLSDDNVIKEAKNLLKIDCFSSEAKGKYASVGKQILDSNSPIFVATDGAHEDPSPKDTHQRKSSDATQTNTSASFVLCIANMELGTNDKCPNSTQTIWEDRPSIPLLCRVSSLPNHFGTSPTDIAHGEAMAIAMQEWTLPHYIPRILVTDSESVRNVNLKLRGRENNKVDRRLVRTMLGGVSKFITSELLSYLNQGNHQIAENRSNSTISPHLRQKVTLLRSRLKQAEEAAKKWITTADTPEEEDIRKYGRWRKDYYDSHDNRIFFKINSHQLNRSGTEIKTQPRYPKLSPNLCLLNMNHHADATADLGKSFQKNENYNQRTQLLRPPSILRYHFTWGGRIVDRHISEFVREKINLERLFRLQSKATQGLAWRFIDHVSADWKKINLHKGWKRALMGLSRTHSRSMYKSEVYRNGCAKEFESKCPHVNEAHSNTESPKKNSIIAKYSKCMWCPDHCIKPSPHGNRKHAMLDCKHPDLQNFRRKMSNLIELKIKNLFVHVKTATSEEHLQNLFGKVEKECLFLQKSTLGRCKKTIHIEKFSYITADDLKKKYNLENMIEGCMTSGTVFSELIGIIPQSTAMNVQDRDLGLLDAFWLGLIPNSINNIFLESIHKKELSQYTPDTTACVAMARELNQAWSEIQDLIMAKAIGLHRIIGHISKEKEKSFRKNEENQNVSQASTMKTDSEISKTSPTCKIPSSDTKQHSKRPKLTNDIPIASSAIPQPKTKPMIFCKGITCNKQNSRWCLDQAFNANKIEHHRKHCVRCSKFCTAMKQGVEILDNIQKLNNAKEIRQLQHIFTIATTTGINYASLMHSLEKCQRDIESSTEAKYIKKTKILDRHKLICRILVYTYRTTPSNKIQNQLHHLLPSIALRLRKGIITSQILAKTKDKKIETITADIPITSNNEIIEIEDTQSQQESKNSGNSPLPTNNGSKIRRLQAEILMERNYISDEAITTAIEVLRQDAKSNNIFIAHGLANINILAWGPTQGWERFSRIFNSNTATFTRPNGIYVIPIFESGHWYIIAIRKQNRFHQGWILDSLQGRQANGNFRNRIQEAFAGNRGRVEWTTINCLRQTECECGPRTIIGIEKICKGIEEGVSISQSITNASMINVDTESYEPQQIRRLAANILRRHTIDMRSKSIRFRQRGSQIVAKRNLEGRKRKHNRGR